MSESFLDWHSEQIGESTLYLGDCLQILPTLCGIDTFITDPPYGIEGLVGGYGRSGLTIAGDEDLAACGGFLRHVTTLEQPAWVVVFYSSRISPDFFACTPTTLKYFGEIIWNKKVPGMGTQIRYQHENIAIFKHGEPPPINNIFSVLSLPRMPEEHPHQKPVGVMRRCLEAVGGGTVCDPFMGSGSTGVACAKMGKKFIGIEIDADHYETACRRIYAAYNQPDLFA